MNLPALEVLISEAMRKIKSRFSEADFYLGCSVGSSQVLLSLGFR